MSIIPINIITFDEFQNAKRLSQLFKTRCYQELLQHLIFEAEHGHLTSPTASRSAKTEYRLLVKELRSRPEKSMYLEELIQTFQVKNEIAG